MRIRGSRPPLANSAFIDDFSVLTAREDSLSRIVFVASLLLCPAAQAHDTWVQTNTNLVRTGDAVHVDLMLGNHGNEHRDFKLASKVALDGCTLAVVDPEGKRYDIRDRLVDTGYTPREGFWSARFAGMKPGLYLVAHSLDRVVNHGRPVRSIKSAKTFFVMSDSLDRVPANNPGHDRVLGHALELVPTRSPVTPMGPGQPVGVRLLFQGKPLPKTRVSFIPRGTELAEGFDANYERTTDEAGEAVFTPKEGNYYLVVAHMMSEDKKSAEYDRTQYSATLSVFVPELCPCCGE